MAQKILKIVGKTVSYILLCVLLYLLLTCVVIPRFQKNISKAEAASGPPLPEYLGDATERVLCVDDNYQALIWRLRVIEAAQEELILSTYDFVDDNSGRDILATLLMAAERGVKIRIIIDGRSGLEKDECFRALVAMPNVEARFYNPFNLLTLRKANYRMHDKYLVADDTVYLLGGRNIRDTFLGEYTEHGDIDRDMLVYSPKPDSRTSLAQIKAYFDEMWQLPCCENLNSPPPESENTAQALHVRYNNLKKAYPEAFAETDWEAETIPTGGVRFLSNPPHPGNKQPTLWKSMVRLMENGESTIIQTPYIMSSGEMYRDLTRLTESGKKVEIVINSIETGANPWGCTDYMNQKRNILETGVEVYEHVGASSVHTKTVLIDDRYSIVGSFNCDMRSAYLDTEVMVVIDCPELNAQLQEVVRYDMEHSRHILPDGTEILGEAYEPKEISLKKQIFYGILRIGIIPFRHLL